MENLTTEGVAFKFNVTLDKRIPNEKIIADVLESVPGKRRGDLVRSLLMEGLAYRQAARSNGVALMPPPILVQPASAPVFAAPTLDQGMEAPVEVEPPVKKDLFDQ